MVDDAEKKEKYFPFQEFRIWSKDEDDELDVLVNENL